MQARTRWSLVLVSVLLATASFPPLDWGWLAWIALAPFLCALYSVRTAPRAFGLGWVFGALHWGWTITWIGDTVSGWASTPWGWAAWAGLAMIKAGWFGLFALLAWRIGQRTRGVGRVAATAAAWTLVEWLRGQGGLAMPWSLIGYTQYRVLPLIQIADVVGVYGVTVAVAWANAAVAAAWVERSRAPRSPLAPRAVAAVAIAAAPALLAASYGLAAVGRAYAGPSFRVTAMQPNLASYPRVARTPEEDLQALTSLAASAAPDRPGLVVWPESIAPESLTEDTETRQTFARMGRALGCPQLVGANREDSAHREFNSAFLLSPDGGIADVYDKQWLVPFGEWIPGRNWLPFGDVFHFFERDVQPGRPRPPLTVGPARIGVLICFESVFPALSRDHVRRGANLLVSITNDSWSGPSKVLQQHLAMAVFRGVETRRWVALSGTTGITGFADPLGHVRAAPPYRATHSTANVRLIATETPYVRWGDWLVFLCAVVSAVGLARPRFDAARAGEVQ
jgi:apolipoprotein N-acyltransferase